MGILCTTFGTFCLSKIIPKQKVKTKQTTTKKTKQTQYLRQNPYTGYIFDAYNQNAHFPYKVGKYLLQPVSFIPGLLSFRKTDIPRTTLTFMILKGLTNVTLVLQR